MFEIGTPLCEVGSPNRATYPLHSEDMDCLRATVTGTSENYNTDITDTEGQPLKDKALEGKVRDWFEKQIKNGRVPLNKAKRTR